VEGTYSVDGDRLQFHPVRQVSWDLFDGKSSPVRVIEPYPYGTVFDTRFAIVGEQLILDYLSYPLDAPVATTLEFTRFVDSTSR
jgi:hypothetical protein